MREFKTSFSSEIEEGARYLLYTGMIKRTKTSPRSNESSCTSSQTPAWRCWKCRGSQTERKDQVESTRLQAGLFQKSREIDQDKKSTKQMMQSINTKDVAGVFDADGSQTPKEGHFYVIGARGWNSEWILCNKHQLDLLTFSRVHSLSLRDHNYIGPSTLHSEEVLSLFPHRL